MRAASLRGRAAAGPLAIVLATFLLGLVGVLTARPGGANDPAQTLEQAVGGVACAIVGAVLLARLPGHRIGRLLLWAGAWATISIAASGLGDLGLAVHPGSVPGAVWFAWVAQWAWAPYVSAFVLIALLFPTGNVAGPRWRAVAGLGVAVAIVGSLGSALSPWSPDPYAVQNPLAPGGAAGAVVAVALAVSTVLVVVGCVLSAVSVVVRYRRASAVESAQLRWFSSAAIVALTAAVINIAVSSTSATGAWSTVLYASGLVTFASVLLVPLAIGIAILRYRLYEIDRLVSRTIAWAVVTGALVGSFAILVLVLQAPLDRLTGGTTVAVAASTLAVAALFQPLRSRVQRAVDRRFDRARYDAERTVAALTARLRDETDLERVGAEVEAAVRQALAPSLVVVWTRER